MDKELKQLLDEARANGFTLEQLDDIVQRYNAKKKSQEQTSTSVSETTDMDMSMEDGNGELNLIDEYEKTVNLNDEDLKTINEQVENDNKAEWSFIDKLKSAYSSASKASNLLPNYDFEHKTLVKKQKIADNLKKQGIEPKKEIIDSIFIDDRTKELQTKRRDAKIEEFIEELPKDEKDEYLNIFSQKHKSLGNKSLAILSDIEILDKKITDKSNLLEQKRSEFDNSIVYPKEYYQENIAALNEINSLKEERDKLNKDLNNVKDDISTTENEIDLFKRNYGKTYNTVMKVVGATGDLLVNLDTFNSEYNPQQILIDKVNETLLGLNHKEANKELREDIENLKSTLRRPKSVDDINDIETAVEWGLDLVAEQTPNTVLMLTTGGASLPLLGASTAGSKFYEMEQEEQQKGIKYSKLQKYGAPLLYGTAEALSEKISLGQLNSMKRVFKSASKQKLVDATTHYLKDILQEGGTESVSQFAQNITDKYMLGKDDINLTDGLKESFIGGAVMSNMFKAPLLFKPVINIVTPKSYNERLSKNSDDIIKLSAELKKDLNEKTKKSIEQKRDKLISENDILLSKILENTDNLTSDEKTKLIEIENKKQDISKEAKAIKEETNLDEKTKNDLLKDKSTEFIELENKKDKILKKTAQKNTEQNNVNKILPKENKATENTVLFAKELGTPEQSEFIQGAVEIKVGDANVILKENTETGNIVIESISVEKDKRGKGNFSKAFDKVVALADEKGITLESTILPMENETDFNKWADVITKRGFEKIDNEKGDKIKKGDKLLRIPKTDVTFEKIDTIIDETQKERNTTNDADITINTEQSTEQRENTGIQSTVKSETSKATPKISNKDNVYVTNLNEYEVSVKDGKLEIVPVIKGKEVTKSEVKKVKKQYIENHNFDTGKRANLENAQPDEVAKRVLDDSENAQEVAETILSTEFETTDNTGTKEYAIATVLKDGGVKKSSLKQTVGNQVEGVPVSYYRKINGRQLSLDQIRELAQQHTESEITIQDIADFILENKSPKEVLEPLENETKVELKQKFEKLTGIKATDENIKSVSKMNIVESNDTKIIPDTEYTTTNDDEVPFQTDKEERTYAEIVGKELRGLVNRLMQTGLAKEVRILSNQAIENVLKRLGVENVNLSVDYKYETLIPNQRDMIDRVLPDPSKIKTKEQIADYNARVEILNNLYENELLGEDEVYDLESDFVLNKYGEKRYFDEIVEEKIEELDDIPIENVDYLLDETTFPLNLSIEELAIQSKGITDNVAEAGYVLTDGRLLDFSGKRQGGGGNVRYEDHRQLNIPIENDVSGTELMYRFMATTGAIRIDASSGMIDILTKPTKSQINVIRSILKKNKNGWFIDLHSENKQLSIKGGNVDMGINAIDKFYSEEDYGNDTNIIRFQKELSDNGITLTPNGFVYNDVVYINRDKVKRDTPIHEFGHLWNKLAKEQHPEIYQKGLKLIEGTEYNDKVKENPAYNHLTEEGKLEEALAQAIGEKGAKILNESKKSKFANWLKTLFNKIAKGLGIRNLTGEKLQKITLEEYTDLVGAELLSGQKITDKYAVPDKTDIGNIDVIVEKQKAIQELRKKLKDKFNSEKDFTTSIKSLLSKYIRANLDVKSIDNVKKRELNKLLHLIEKTRSKKQLLKAFKEVDKITAILDNRKLSKVAEKLLTDYTEKKESGKLVAKRTKSAITQDAVNILKDINEKRNVPKIKKEKKSDRNVRIKERITDLENQIFNIEYTEVEDNEGNKSYVLNELSDSDNANLLNLRIAVSMLNAEISENPIETNRLLSQIIEDVSFIREQGIHELQQIREQQKNSLEKEAKDILEEVDGNDKRFTNEFHKTLTTLKKDALNNASLVQKAKRIVKKYLLNPTMTNFKTVVKRLVKNAKNGVMLQGLERLVTQYNLAEIKMKSIENRWDKQRDNIKKSIFGSVFKADKALTEPYTITKVIEIEPGKHYAFEQKITTAVLLDAWLKYKDKSNRNGLAKEGYTDKVINDIDNLLPEKVKQYGESLIDWYRNKYDEVNDVYKRMYFRDMPFNEFYSGMLNVDGMRESVNDDILKSISRFGSVVSPSVKSRVTHNKSITPTSVESSALHYTNSMARFIAYAEINKRVNNILKNEDINKAIVLNNGNSGMDLLDVIKLHKDLHVERSESTKASRIVNWLNKNFVQSTLFIKLKSLPIQTSSFINGLIEMPENMSVSDWKNVLTNYVSDVKWLLENSDYLKERLNTKATLNAISNIDDIRSDRPILTSNARIQLYLNKADEIRDKILNTGGLAIKIGDLIGVLGNVGAFTSNKKRIAEENPNMSRKQVEQEAMLLFEKSVDEIQQPITKGNKTFLQNHPFGKLLMNFSTTQILNINHFWLAIKDLERHKRQFLRKNNTVKKIAKSFKINTDKIDNAKPDKSLTNDIKAVVNYGFIQPASYVIWNAILTAGGYEAMTSVFGLIGDLFDDEDDKKQMEKYSDDTKELGRILLTAGVLEAPLASGAGKWIFDTEITERDFTFGSAVSLVLLDESKKMVESYKTFKTAKRPETRLKAKRKFIKSAITLGGIAPKQLVSFIQYYDVLHSKYFTQEERNMFYGGVTFETVNHIRYERTHKKLATIIKKVEKPKKQK